MGQNVVPYAYGPIYMHMGQNTYKKYNGSSTRPELLAFYADSQKLNHLKIELAAVVDWGEVFVKETYNLEGDDPLAHAIRQIRR